MSQWADDDVILYDGVCVFCSRWVRFVAMRDVNRRFRFTAIQSVYGSRLAQALGIDPRDPDTNAVIHGGVAFFKSDAALTVLSSLPGWGWTRLLRVVPKPLRDAVYSLVARNRYRIFGQYDFVLHARRGAAGARAGVNGNRRSGLVFATRPER